MSGRGLFASFPTIRNGRFGRFPGETVRLKRRMGATVTTCLIRSVTTAEVVQSAPVRVAEHGKRRAHTLEGFVGTAAFGLAIDRWTFP